MDMKNGHSKAGPVPMGFHRGEGLVWGFKEEGDLGFHRGKGFVVSKRRGAWGFIEERGLEFKRRDGFGVS